MIVRDLSDVCQREVFGSGANAGYSKNEMTKTDRMMAIVLLLRSRKRVSAQTLADMFEMHIRTIYSDVAQ